MVDIFVSDPRIFLSGFTGLVAIRYIDFVISCAITANDAFAAWLACLLACIMLKHESSMGNPFYVDC